MRIKFLAALLLLPALAFAQVTIYAPGERIRIGGSDIRLSAPAFDSDAISYFIRSGVTDATAKRQISDFVRGVKALGLWSNMVCWPLRSAQNAGSGVTAYSLGGLGTFNGTLVNGPTWGVDGVTFTGASAHRITTGITVSYNVEFALFACLTRTTAENGNRVFGTIGSANSPFFYRAAGSTAVGAFNGTSYSTFVTPANNSINFVSLRYSTTQLTGILNASAPSATAYTPAVVNQVISIGAGQSAGTLCWTGPIPFAGYLLAASSDANMAALAALYKNTLGQGLGLP